MSEGFLRGVDQWISTSAASLNHLLVDMPVMWVKGKVVEEVTNSGWSKYLTKDRFLKYEMIFK